MFSRRHPYLFFVLVFSAIAAGAILTTSALVLWGVRDADFAGGEKVGVVEIEGVIANPRDIIAAIKEFREDDTVKAIVLRIDSPGGGVGPTQEIYREVRKTRGKKQIVASLGSIAASGGYYVAAAADRIVTSRGTITGSIGVIMGFTNFQQLMEKIGLVPVVVKSGAYKDMGSPVREMTESERKLLEDMTAEIHHQFVADIAAGRNMPVEEVAAIADGRIFSGERAKALGLVDRFGNIEDAIVWAGRLGGIEGEVNAVYAPEEEVPLLRFLTKSWFRRAMAGVYGFPLFPAFLYVPPGAGAFQGDG